MASKCVNSGATIRSTVMATPIGPLELRSCPKGFHSIQPVSTGQPIPAVTELSSSNVITIAKHGDDNLLDEATISLKIQQEWVAAYFQNSDQNIKSIELEFSNFCIQSVSTIFERMVYKGLFERVKFGETRSYRELAVMVLDSPNSARAVGTALKKNPLLLMIPCHRIIRSDGSLGKFSGGKWDNCKQYLYDYEHRANPES